MSASFMARPEVSIIVHGQPKNWYAVYTSVNQERIVAQRLSQRGIEQYLPLYSTVRRRSDRRVNLTLPLFPGYLFVRIALAEKVRVLEVPRVLRLVGGNSVALAVPEKEIELLKNGLSAPIQAQPCPYVSTGCSVRVLNGPFSGAEGILLKRRQRFRVVLSVHTIMRSFTLEVSEEDIQPIPAPKSAQTLLATAR